MRMSQRVARHLSLLNTLKNSRGARRKKIIKDASGDFVLTLCELAYNVLKGKIPLNARQYSRIRRHKKCLRSVARKKGVNGRKRRRLLCQQGGFLPALLGVALPFITSLLSNRG